MMQPVTVIQRTSQPNSVRGGKVLQRLGVSIIFIGIAMIALDAVIVGLIYSDSRMKKFSLYSGIWGGILCAIPGVIGFFAGRPRRHNGLAIATIVLSVIGCVPAFVVICIQGYMAASCLNSCTITIYVLHCVIAVITTGNFVLLIVLSAFGCRAVAGSETPATMVITNYPAMSSGDPPPAYSDMSGMQPTATAYPANYFPSAPKYYE